MNNNYSNKFSCSVLCVLAVLAIFGCFCNGRIKGSEREATNSNKSDLTADVAKFLKLLGKSQDDHELQRVLVENGFVLEESRSRSWRNPKKWHCAETNYWTSPKHSGVVLVIEAILNHFGPDKPAKILNDTKTNGVLRQVILQIVENTSFRVNGTLYDHPQLPLALQRDWSEQTTIAKLGPFDAVGYTNRGTKECWLSPGVYLEYREGKLMAVGFTKMALIP